MNLIFSKNYGLHFVYDQDNYDGAPDTPASGQVMGSSHISRYHALRDFAEQMIDVESLEVAP